MSEVARDSGIIVDDESSETSSIRACEDCSKMSYVQKLRKRFELLSKENDREFHSGCNWWLDDEDEQHVVSVERQESETTLIEDVEEQFELQKQVSVTSQKSSKSYKSLHSQTSLRSQRSFEEEASEPPNVPKITLECVNDDDEVFESADDIEEEIEAQYVRHNEGKREHLSRPPSITSQTSK